MCIGSFEDFGIMQDEVIIFDGSYGEWTEDDLVTLATEALAEIETQEPKESTECSTTLTGFKQK